MLSFNTVDLLHNNSPFYHKRTVYSVEQVFVTPFLCCLGGRSYHIFKHTTEVFVHFSFLLSVSVEYTVGVFFGGGVGVDGARKAFSTPTGQNVSQFHASFFFENFRGGSRIFLGDAIYHQSGCANLIVCKFLPKTA